MPPKEEGGKQKKKKKKKKEEEEEGRRKHLGGDGLAEKGGEESGWKEDSGERRFEKVDMRQLKETMGDNMIMVENLVSMPKEDCEKILSQYVSNVDEKDKERADITLKWAVNKLVEEEAAERERSVTEAQRGHEEKGV